MSKNFYKKGYTLAEIVVTIIVLGIVASLTLKITAIKLTRVNRYNYYAAYNVLSELASELIYESEDGTIPTSNLCVEFQDRLNLTSEKVIVNDTERTPSCSIGHSINSSTDFSNIVPNLVARNGIRFYNLSSIPSAITQLNGAAGNDLMGYTIYVDLDGQRGEAELWKDVVPFYLTISGKVIPAYPASGSITISGGNSKDAMMFSVRYDEYLTQAGVDKREEHWLVKSATFKEAACKSGYVKSTNYCNGVTIDTHCSLDNSDCILVPLRPIKYLWK